MNDEIKLAATVWYFEDNESKVEIVKNFKDYRIIAPNILLVWDVDGNHLIYNGHVWTSLYIGPEE